MTATGARGTALVVEDDGQIAHILRFILEREGFVPWWEAAWLPRIEARAAELRRELAGLDPAGAMRDLVGPLPGLAGAGIADQTDFRKGEGHGKGGTDGGTGKLPGRGVDAAGEIDGHHRRPLAV